MPTKKIIIEVTEAEARAITRALSCPLDGDRQDAEAIFLNTGGIAAAHRARSKVCGAMNPGFQEIIRNARAALDATKYRAMLDKVATALYWRHDLDSGLSKEEKALLRRAYGLLGKEIDL